MHACIAIATSEMLNTSYSLAVSIYILNDKSIKFCKGGERLYKQSYVVIRTREKLRISKNSELNEK